VRGSTVLALRHCTLVDALNWGAGSDEELEPLLAADRYQPPQDRDVGRRGLGIELVGRGQERDLARLAPAVTRTRGGKIPLALPPHPEDDYRPRSHTALRRVSRRRIVYASGVTTD
jgi:hypothetical protein